jgi:hypothetical protein
MVEFNVQIGPQSESKFRTVHYTAEFLNGGGERIVVTKDKQIETDMLKEPHTAAWLLSHILKDFMLEVGESSASND